MNKKASSLAELFDGFDFKMLKITPKSVENNALCVTIMVSGKLIRK